LQRPRRSKAGPRARATLPAFQSRRSFASHHRSLPPAQSRGQQRTPSHPRTCVGAASLRPCGDGPSCGHGSSTRPRRAKLGQSKRHRRSVTIMRKMLVSLFLLLLAASASAQRIQFRDITAQAGIHFVHNNGAFGKKYLPETMGSGCAFIDYDNDGWPDILLINSEDWPGHKRSDSTLKLYHNNHDGTFTDVTRKAGLAVSMYGMGVAVSDYDNDGFDDIFISA